MPKFRKYYLLKVLLGVEPPKNFAVVLGPK